MKNSKYETAIVSLAAAGVVLAFWRPTSDVFDVVKATVLWMGAVLAIPAVVLRYSSFRAEELVGELKASWHVLQFVLLAAVTSLVSSDFLMTSLFGQAGRYTSLLTLASGAMLFLACRHLSSSSIRTIVVVVVVANYVSGLYVLLQASGNDPYQWQSGSFSDFVFGTMGNPNFATTVAAASCCLSFFLLLDPKSSIVLRGFAGSSMALCLGMIGIFESFQGSVALAPLVVMVVAVGLFERQRLRWMIAAGLLSVAAIAVSFRRFSVTVVIVAVLAGAVVGVLLHGSRSKETSKAQEERIRVPHVGLGLGLIAVLTLVVGIVLRDTVSAGFSQGFVERGDFYRAAWSGIKERPIFGFGLDTFGKYFPQFRPASHALNLEGNRTSSVHSVYLGMMFTGGAVLLTSFLVFVFRPVVSSARAVADRARNERYQILGVLMGFVSILITFLVSTEHVTVHALLFVLAGLLSRLVSPPSRQAAAQSSKKHRRQRAQTSSRRSMWLTGIAVVVAVALVPTMLRPMRAARLDFLGQVAFFADDYPLALGRFESAASLAPWISTYHLRTAELAANLEQFETMQFHALAVVREGNYIASEAVKAAQLMAFTGDLESAISILERTFQHDPYALQLGALISELAGTIDQVAQREGFPEVSARAQELLRKVEDVRVTYGTQQ